MVKSGGVCFRATTMTMTCILLNDTLARPKFRNIPKLDRSGRGDLAQIVLLFCPNLLPFVGEFGPTKSTHSLAWANCLCLGHFSQWVLNLQFTFQNISGFFSSDWYFVHERSTECQASQCVDSRWWPQEVRFQTSSYEVHFCCWGFLPISETQLLNISLQRTCCVWSFGPSWHIQLDNAFRQLSTSRVNYAQRFCRKSDIAQLIMAVLRTAYEPNRVFVLRDGATRLLLEKSDACVVWRLVGSLSFGMQNTSPTNQEAAWTAGVTGLVCWGWNTQDGVMVCLFICTFIGTGEQTVHSSRISFIWKWFHEQESGKSCKTNDAFIFFKHVFYYKKIFTVINVFSATTALLSCLAGLYHFLSI